MAITDIMGSVRVKPTFIRASFTGTDGVYLNINQIDYFFAGKHTLRGEVLVTIPTDGFSVFAVKLVDSEFPVHYTIKDGFADENEADAYLQTLLRRISTMENDEYLIDPDHI